MWPADVSLPSRVRSWAAALLTAIWNVLQLTSSLERVTGRLSSRMAVKRHHDHGRPYKCKHSNGAGFRFRGLVHCGHAGSMGVGVGEGYIQSHRQKEEQDTGPGSGIEPSKPTPVIHFLLLVRECHVKMANT